jgi:hypothetical protein
LWDGGPGKDTTSNLVDLFIESRGMEKSDQFLKDGFPMGDTPYMDIHIGFHWYTRRKIQSEGYVLF